MKKIFALLIAGGFVLSVASCGEGKKNETEVIENDTTQVEVEKTNAEVETETEAEADTLTETETITPETTTEDTTQNQ